jgi:Bacterial regulatory protein, Fis family.
VKRAYERFDGDVDRAAVALDIGRSTMYRMIKRHNLRDDES